MTSPWPGRRLATGLPAAMPDDKNLPNLRQPSLIFVKGNSVDPTVQAAGFGAS
jgi:hypothetical protein